MQIKTGWSTSPPPNTKPSILDDDDDADEFKTRNRAALHSTPPPLNHPNKEIRATSSPAGKPLTPNKSITSVGKSAATKSIKIKSKPQLSHNFDDCSYDSLLQSYSDEANLCSTPEIRDIYMAAGELAGGKKAKDVKLAADQSPGK